MPRTKPKRHTRERDLWKLVTPRIRPMSGADRAVTYREPVGLCVAGGRGPGHDLPYSRRKLGHEEGQRGGWPLLQYG